MPTLIISKGRKRSTHRCDERCYDSADKKCRCICQGKNHGVGLKQALINTAMLAEQYPQSTEPSFFHHLTEKVLDIALRLPNNIRPLVLLFNELQKKKEGG